MNSVIKAWPIGDANECQYKRANVGLDISHLRQRPRLVVELVGV